MRIKLKNHWQGTEQFPMTIAEAMEASIQDFGFRVGELEILRQQVRQNACCMGRLIEALYAADRLSEREVLSLLGPNYEKA